MLNWTQMLTKFCLFLFALLSLTAHSAELQLREVESPAQTNATVNQPNQLPQSRITYSKGNIKSAWLVDPTDRYRHGVLGDALEAGGLVVEKRDGGRLHMALPANRVFEDLQPRLVDLDGDGQSEIIVVESDRALGASLAVYGLVDGKLAKRAATPFIGLANRWLNPLGAGDFDGDGRLDIALVETPHIGGILRLYHFDTPNLKLFAEYYGVSTHRIGSTELGLGRVVSARPRDLMLVPDQSRKVLMLLEFRNDEFNVLAKKRLPASLGSSLNAIESGLWRFRLIDGRNFVIQLVR
ncbi:FG-GAP repeat domain-containing protein [Pseudomonadota bacterium]